MILVMGNLLQYCRNLSFGYIWIEVKHKCELIVEYTVMAKWKINFTRLRTEFNL